MEIYISSLPINSCLNKKGAIFNPNISCHIYNLRMDMVLDCIIFRGKPKRYKTMAVTGAGNIALGVVILISGIACGVVAIVSGGRLLKRKSDIIF